MSKGNYNSIGVAGRPGSNINQVNRGDWSLKGYTFRVSPNDGSVQSTGVYLPANSIAKRAFVRVFNPEVTGTTPTVTVTRTGSGNILAGITVDASAGPVTGASNGLLSGGVYSVTGDREEITYTLGSGDFAELDAEVYIEVFTAGE